MLAATSTFLPDVVAHPFRHVPCHMPLYDPHGRQVPRPDAPLLLPECLFFGGGIHPPPGCHRPFYSGPSGPYRTCWRDFLPERAHSVESGPHLPRAAFSLPLPSNPTR